MLRYWRWIAAVFVVIGYGALAQNFPSNGGRIDQSASLGPTVINIVNYGASPSVSDNKSAIQAAINAAIANNATLYIPYQSSCYKYTAPLTINGNLKIRGDNVTGNWNGSGGTGVNVPQGNPVLLGSVICPSSNGSDGIDITGTSTSVGIENLGILFQTAFSGTGDGINYVPASSQGLTGSQWNNVMVYGHDGNHYGYNLQNFIYDTFIDCFSFGGGVFNLNGTTGALNYGNSVFIHPYGQVVVGGSSNGYTVTAGASQKLNLLTFIRPQAITDNLSGVSPGGNPPTSAQDIWHQDTNARNIRVIGGDFETNVSSSMTTNAGQGNDMDWATLFQDAVNFNIPSWTTNGAIWGPGTRTMTDTTGSGTIANQTMFSMPATHFASTSSETITHASTLWLGKPIASANVTATRLESLYADGAVFVNSNVTDSGEFVTGNTQINKTASTATTEIGNGTTTGTVTIGGANNTLALGAATLTSNGVTAVSCAANSVSLTTFVVTNGIVTHC